MIYLWLAVCLSLSATAGASSLNLQSIYDELIEMNATCGDLDNCHGYRSTDDLRVVNCQCGPICAQFGTCCLDSEYRNGQIYDDLKHMALSTPYRATEDLFMISVCKPGWDGDSNIKDLCGYDGSIVLDPFLMVPVTNPRTWITYKNYFCFVCNEGEDSDSPVLWDFHLFHLENITLGPVSELVPGGNMDLYTANGQSVYMVVGAPKKIAPRLHWYSPRVISTCSTDWTDLDTKEKCEAYAALVFYNKLYSYRIFRNPHCAICNHVSLSDVQCSEPDRFKHDGGPPYGTFFVGLFSFEDKVSKCPRNQVFDTYGKKCRAVRCGRNQKLVGTSCVAKSEPQTKLEASTTDPQSLAPRPQNGFIWKPHPRASDTTVVPELSSQTENLISEYSKPDNFEMVFSQSPSTTTKTTQNPHPGPKNRTRLPSGPKPSTGEIRPRPPRRVSTIG